MTGLEHLNKMFHVEHKKINDVGKSEMLSARMGVFCMNYDLIASELSMIITEHDNDIETRVYNFLEYYLKNEYPNIPKRAYFSIIDRAFRIYNKMP